jgi:hypothetical protein
MILSSSNHYQLKSNYGFYKFLSRYDVCNGGVCNNNLGD